MNDISLQDKERIDFEETARRVLIDSTPDSGARRILLYFYKFSQNITKYGTINPGNKHLAKRFGWTANTLRAHLCIAKKTGFLSTVGNGKLRYFIFNQALLVEKTMLFLQQKEAKKPVENHVENSQNFGVKSKLFLANSVTNQVMLPEMVQVMNQVMQNAQITPVISALNVNEKMNEKNNNGKICEKIKTIFESYKSNKITLKNAVYEAVRLCDSLRSSHCEPTKVVSHDLCFPDKSNLEQLSLFDYLDYLTSIDKANANTVPKGLDANAISVELNQMINLPLFSGNVGEADVKEKVPEVVCSAVAVHTPPAFTKTYAVASPEPREALCTVKDECHIVSENNTPHRASHDLTQNPPLSKSPIAGIKSGERLPKRPSSTSSVPFSTPVRADNLELKKRQTRGAYAEATNLLKQLQFSFGNFQITRGLVTNAKNMIGIFTSEKILKAVDAYLNASWVTAPNIYSFLSEKTLGRFATIVEKPKQNPYADYPDDRLPFQKNVDENLINNGLMPSYMNKELIMKYDIYDWLYDENGEPHKYRIDGSPEHDQWLIDHVHERPWLLDYYDPEYKTIIYPIGSPEYEKDKQRIDKGNAHIAELRKLAGLEV
nr:MAG TPA: winged helix-turn-helix DNA-binding protein [Caudoviricetes sp.]